MCDMTNIYTYTHGNTLQHTTKHRREDPLPVSDEFDHLTIVLTYVTKKNSAPWQYIYTDTSVYAYYLHTHTHTHTQTHTQTHIYI